VRLYHEPATRGNNGASSLLRTASPKIWGTRGQRLLLRPTAQPGERPTMPRPSRFPTTRHSRFLSTRHSLLATRRSPSFTARRSLSLTIRHSLFPIRHSPFAVSFRSPLATRRSPSSTIRHSRFAIRTVRWVSTNGRSAKSGDGRGEACLAPTFADQRVAHPCGRWAAGKMPVPQHNQGGSGTRPYLDQHHSPFAISHSPSFSAHRSPLATRRSPSFTIRHSLFAIRCLFPFAIRRSR
jgi:hypothetical protein